MILLIFTIGSLFIQFEISRQSLIDHYSQLVEQHRDQGWSDDSLENMEATFENLAAFKPVSSLIGILPQLLGIIAFILCAQLISNKWVPFLAGALIGCLPIFFLFRPHHTPDLFIAITIGHLSS